MLGVGGMSGIYPSQYRQYMLDAEASGPFELFGRTHQLAVGASASRSTGKEWENFSTDDIEFPSIFDWGQQQVAEPSYPGTLLQTETVDKLYRVYASTRLTLTDRTSRRSWASPSWTSRRAAMPTASIRRALGNPRSAPTWA